MQCGKNVLHFNLPDDTDLIVILRNKFLFSNEGNLVVVHLRSYKRK